MHSFPELDVSEFSLCGHRLLGDPNPAKFFNPAHLDPFETRQVQVDYPECTDKSVRTLLPAAVMDDATSKDSADASLQVVHDFSLKLKVGTEVREVPSSFRVLGRPEHAADPSKLLFRLQTMSDHPMVRITGALLPRDEEDERNIQCSIQERREECDRVEAHLCRHLYSV